MLNQLRGRPIGTNPLVRVVRYEDLWEGGADAFAELFVFLGLTLPGSEIAEIVRRNGFEARSGRKAG